MKSILIISFTKLYRDARVLRQINFIRTSYQVTVVAPDTLDMAGVVFIPTKKPPLTLVNKILLSVYLLTRMYRKAHRILYGIPPFDSIRAAGPYDLIIANDVEALPTAFEVQPDAKVLFDAHEYAPRHFENKLSWRIFFQPFNTHLCRKYIPLLQGMTTIGTGLANEYNKHFHIEPVIITNATTFTDVQPSAVIPGKIRMIHHGAATVSRFLEIHFELMAHLDNRFTLDFMLIAPEFGSAQTMNYISHLKSLAAADPRIRIIPAVKSSEVSTFINQYDLGIFLLPPVNFNYANTLPNKLFEFIQARLGIAIGPTPEMAKVVTEYGIGVISDDFTAVSLARELNKLTSEDIQRFKSNSVKAAQDLNAEKNSVLFNQLVGEILVRPVNPR